MKRMPFTRICLLLVCFSAVMLAYVKDDMWQVHKAAEAPVIDGMMDDVYFTASTERVVVSDYSMNTPDSYLDGFGEARLMWDEDYFYVFIKVVDDEISSSSANSYENDGVEVYFDAGNDKEPTYGVDDIQTRIEFEDGWDAFLYDNCPAGTEGATMEWEAIDGDGFGYNIEVAYPIDELQIESKAGTVFGFEIQINDRDNETREHMLRWWGDDNMAWADPSLFGTAVLIDYKADEVLNILPAPAPMDIDGVLDDAWQDVPAIESGTYVYTNNDIITGIYTEITEWEDAQMEFRVGWDENNFYIWVEVIDDELSAWGANSYENDSIELDFDGGNEKSYNHFDSNDIQMRWVWDDPENDANAPNSVFAWGELEDPALNGYSLECAIPLEDLTFSLESSTEIGFEIQINDRDNGTRENIIRWWGSDDYTWTDASRMGTAVLTGQADNAPKAAFSGYPRSGAAPLTVIFDDQSSGDITSYIWDFGDDQISVNSDVSHTYQNPGVYTVSLTVTGPGGFDVEEKSNYITVTDTEPVDENMLQIVKASYAPVIDGDMDEIWYTATTERIVKPDAAEGSPPDDYLDLFSTMRLMWDDTSLYLFIKVVDDEISSSSANSYENDGVEIYFDGDNSKTPGTYDGVDDLQTRIEYQDGDDVYMYDSVPDGTEGAVADWANMDGDAFGYIIEVQYPLAELNIDAESGSIFGFEVQINDRDNQNRETLYRWWGTDNNAWNDASLFGTAELIGYQADDYLNIPYTATPPEIDGVLDPVWQSGAPPIYQGTYVFTNGGVVGGQYFEIYKWEDAQMEFRTLWDDDFFYFWCEVIDDELSTTSANSWENDSIELYFDGDNAKAEAYDFDDIQWRWVWDETNNEYVPGNETFAWGELPSGLNGYTFELAIPWEDLTFDLEEGLIIGFELQVNDRDNERRENMIRWWSDDNMSWDDPSLFGNAVFLNHGPVINPIITLQTPNGGETWDAGTQRNIQWTSQLVSTVKLEYSDNNGASWHVIQTGITASNGSYTWTVPAVNSDQCKVRITDTSQPSVSDVSNQVFQISHADLALQTPSGGETWEAGTPHAIQWTSQSVTTVKLEYSDDNGDSWNIIRSSFSASIGSYTWIVPAVSSDFCKVRISDTNRPSVSDVSDVFQISHADLALQSPNGSETYKSGETVEIQWQSSGIDNVNIYVSYNNGIAWKSIASDQPSNGTWSWKVPFIMTNQALIKIEDADDTSVNDISDNTFTIKSGFITGVDASSLPTEFSLDQNAPNPFNMTTWILYALPETADVNMSIYNIEGKRICTMVQGMQEPGMHYHSWDGKDEYNNAVSSGVYICRMQAKGSSRTFASSRKMFLVK